MLDFSPAMHELARARLGALETRAQFPERALKQPDWMRDLSTCDAVVTMQAVHELKDKRHADKLHAQVLRLLAPRGVHLVCDHYRGERGLSNDRLYMTPPEQEQALRTAGFVRVDRLMLIGTLALYRAIC